MATQARVSITDIAKACAVSVMTVSRALRNKGNVRESTRQRVLETARRLGYTRRPLFGRPADSEERTRPKVLLIAGMVDRRIPLFVSSLFTSIERHLSAKGRDCIVKTVTGDYEQFLSLQNALRGIGANRLVLVGGFKDGQLRSLLEAAPGAILVDNPGHLAAGPACESLGFDNAEAARIGVRHLLATGRRRILLVNGTPQHFFSREVRQGYRDALETWGIPPSPELEVHTNFTAEEAYGAVRSCIEAGQLFDAVFTNDEMASGVYRAVFERGLRIPEDVAVCGCDGLPLGLHLYPRLTTVALDYEDLAQRTVQRLLSARDEGVKPCRVKLLPRLEVRESTLAPAAR